MRWVETCYLITAKIQRSSILVWDLNAIPKMDSKKGDRWICVKGKIIEKNFLVAVVLVYGLNDREGRKKLYMDGNDGYETRNRCSDNGFR